MGSPYSHRDRRSLCFALGALLALGAGLCAHAGESPGSKIPPRADEEVSRPATSAAWLQELEPGAATTGTGEAIETVKDARAAEPAPRSTTPSLRPSFINFGYIQDEAILPHVRWNAVTHVGTMFVDFLADGSLQNPSAFTGRSAALKTGGAAQAAGTKVILVVRNDNFNETTLDTVMQSSTLRNTLANNVRSLVVSDTYCQGVNFDFEFSWSTATRDGISAFLQTMRSILLSPYEISVYTHAIYNADRWNVGAITPSIDYMLYSTYDWATGNRAHAIDDFNNDIPYVDDYIAAGLPPEKMVLTWASYARRWPGITNYNDTGTTPSSRGFTDGLYDTTLRTDYGGPFTSNYVTGDEIGWYTYNDGTSNYVVTWNTPASLEYKIRAALSMPMSSGSVSNGRRLGGVGWWSLMWMAEQSSYDPITATAVSRTRTYPHIYQLCEEILSNPGDKTFLFEGFEGLDARWRDPNYSPDTSGDTDSDSARALVAAPAGTGRPASTNNAVRLTFDFENASGNRLFFRHEVLNSDINTGVTDVNATICRVDANTQFICPIYVAANYSPRTIRMALLDGQREIEVSPAMTLNTTGWQTLTWNINDPTQIQSYNTNEPAFIDGDGVLDTAGGGARDIGFLGFVIEGGAAGSGQVTFDELSYTHRNPGGLNYTINELRYADAASEFVEIKGPAGTIPAGTELRFYNSADGSVLSSVALGGQTIPASGLFVVGDTGVTPAPNLVPGGWGVADNIPNTDPSGIQIYNTSTGNVYDSLVYKAMGGLDDLSRQETHGVTVEGYGWCGEAATGTNSAGTVYTLGRYPDGNDTQVNERDFSFMPATPGSANGNAIPLGTTYNFTAAPASAFQTYQAFSVANPVLAGLPPSPSGGNAHHCVDTGGGGVISVIGDASLGADGNGYSVTGEIYIPGNTEPLQAVAIGICGGQGSTFFAGSPDASGYESGYWLIYENAAGVGLNDGRADHGGTFEFVHATNDRMDGVPAALLGSKTRSAAGVPNGGWTTFALTVAPHRASEQLVAQIGGVDVFRGNLPAGGPTSGAFVAGFRENHTGTPVVSEGTWIDNVRIAEVPKIADLSVTKSDSPDPVAVGEDLTYTVTVSNAGPDTARNIVAVDSLPSGISIVSYSAPSGTFELSGSNLIWSAASLASGAGVPLTIVVRPTGASALVNVVTVSTTDEDPNASNNSATAGTDLTVHMIPYSDETFSTDVTNPTPGATTGWTPFSASQPPAQVADYDAANGALRVTVATSSAPRINGWMSGNSEWMPYSAVGTANYARGKFYVFRTGQTDMNDLNQVPNMRLRLSTRFAVNTMLEVTNHLATDPAGTNSGREIRPVSTPGSPSIYRVDLDPVDVPAMLNAGEGISRGFEAYCLEPQENGAIELTESVIGTYPAGVLGDSGPSVLATKIFQCTASDAGDLKILNTATDGPFFKKFVLVAPGVLGSEVALDGATDPAYQEGSSGVTIDSTAVATDRVGVAVREFTELGANSGRIRVEPARQYKLRWHVTSNTNANRNPQLRLRGRALKFMWSQKLEIGGALAAGNTNNTIAQQVLPGNGTLNPDQLVPGESGGWYTLLMHTPMSTDIQPTQTYLNGQPGPGSSTASVRDVKFGFDLIDTLSGMASSRQETGRFTLDRVELRVYNLIPD